MNNTQDKKVIKQHFIPQFYLKNFLSDKKRIFAFEDRVRFLKRMLKTFARRNIFTRSNEKRLAQAKYTLQKTISKNN
ncbi:MAG: DUF4238 domain-containing protein [Eggerthellaceae bacterium]